MFFKLEDGALAACDIPIQDDPQLAWSQFIDNFRASNTKTREKIVSKAPPLEYGDCVFSACIAATVEALCNEVGMPPPDWVFLPRFTLSEPAWGFNHIRDPAKLAAARELLRKETIREFACRNLFYGANVLSRV